MPFGLYLSVPFCRSKCTYCNFASDVFSRALFDRYVDRVGHDLNHAEEAVKRAGGVYDPNIDSIYLGGGTPTVLDVIQLRRLFVTISQNFHVLPASEVTVECAPGTLAPDTLDASQQCGVNRISLGVQSFVDREAASVARLHKRENVLDDISRLRAAGIVNINVDLIAGLPHQTAESWRSSLTEAIDSGVPHVSVYLLEVDEDSRLGRELIAGGTRYHAHFVPDDDLTADLYLMACERLNAAGVQQYEISNFAREGFESRHNLKYWTRQPYLGFGVDAHSMVHSAGKAREAIRLATPDSLDRYVAGEAVAPTWVSAQSAVEESFFLGLRLNRGVDPQDLESEFGRSALAAFVEPIHDLLVLGLLEQSGRSLRLSPRGRLLSNEVFQRFVGSPQNA